VDAVLALEVSIGVFTLELEGYSLYSGFVACLVVCLCDLIPALLSPHEVHSHEHLCPVIAFCATGACIDLEDGAEAVLLTAQHVAELKFFYCCEGFIILLTHLLIGDFTLFEEVVQDEHVLNGSVDFGESRGPALNRGYLLHEFLCFFRVIPESVRVGNLFLFLDFV